MGNPNIGRLVLGCIEADCCDQIVIAQDVEDLQDCLLVKVMLHNEARRSMHHLYGIVLLNVKVIIFGDKSKCLDCVEDF